MKPWLESDLAQIYNVTERARRDSPCAHPQDDACLGIWLVHAPWMHIAWCWHYVALIHLRDIPGQSKPPTLTLQGATHEFLVYAIDPESPPQLDAPKLEPARFLSPVSIVQQLVAPNDAEALRLVEDGLAQTIHGRMTLDSDGRAIWKSFLLSKT